MIAPRAGHPRPLVLLLLLVGAAGTACGEAQQPTGSTTVQSRAPASPEAPPEPVPAPTPPTPPSPPPAPPPALKGAVAVSGVDLHVQGCGDDAPCPSLTFEAATRHCETLTLADTTGWRLPTRPEFDRIRQSRELQGPSGYHWTSTPYAEDAGQAWIVARDESPSTTIPHDRKPFVARCVRPFATSP